MVAECSQMASLVHRHHPAAMIPFFPSRSWATRRPPSLIRCSAVATPKKICSAYWATAEAEIDAHLAASIPTSPSPAVRDPLLSLVASATPTMAPALCVAACELMGAPRARALGAACALRLVHSAFDAKRPFLGLSPERAEAAFGEGIVLLTAGGLGTLGYQLVAETVDDVAGGCAEPGRVLRVMVELADAAGARGMVEGLYEEMMYLDGGEESGGVDATAAAAAEAEEGWLQRVCRKKEGRLYACAAACGAILAGAGEEETERLRRCGTYVGTMHGLRLYGSSRRGRREEVAGDEQLIKSLALSELEGFEGEVKEAIVGLLDMY